MGLRKLDGTAKVPRTLDRCRRRRGDLGGATQPFDGLLANLERLRFVRPLRAGNAGRFAVMKGDQFGHRILPLEIEGTRLNSSHVSISYAVFCLKKKISVY